MKRTGGCFRGESRGQGNRLLLAHDCVDLPIVIVDHAIVSGSFVR